MGKHERSYALYILYGARFLYRHRNLWKYALAPAFVSGTLLLIGYVILYYYLFEILLTRWYATNSSLQIVYYGVLIVFFAAIALICFFLFGRIASAISGPFSDALSKRTEEIITGRLNELPFSLPDLLNDTGRSLYHAIKMLGLYLGFLVITLPLLFVPVFGGALYTGAGVLVAAYLFAWEYLSYPMDRRRWSWKEKKALLHSNFVSTLTFGLVGVIFMGVPIVNLLLIPSAAVGGAMLFLDLTSPHRSKES